MGEMRDSDWSRQNLLRSDWLGLIGATITTGKIFINKSQEEQPKIIHAEGDLTKIS